METCNIKWKKETILYMKIRNKWASLLVAIFFLLVMASPVLADTYESFTAGDDTDVEGYGVNWIAQTFTSTSSHTIDTIELLLLREGVPGNVTVSVRKALGGLPNGGDLTSGTTDCSAITTDPAGEWVTFNLTSVNLADDTVYVIVVSALSGTATDSIHWRVDTASGYASGNEADSADSGATWASVVANDLMFEVQGEPTLEIVDVGVFSSVMQPNDWYFCILYNVQTPPAYPNLDPGLWYSITVYDNANALARISLPSWGYKPTGIYISPTLASTHVWGGATFTVEIEGSTRWAVPPAYTYTILPTDWLGSNMLTLDSWVRTTAQAIETYYTGSDLYTESIGGVTLPVGQGVLTPDGGEIFTVGMPGLSEIRPDLFYYGSKTPSLTTTPGTHAGEPVWSTQVGPTIAGILTSWGSIFNINGQTFGGTMVFVLFIGCVAVGVATKETPSIIALVVSLPIALGAWYMGLWPLALAAVLSIMVAVVAFWHFWLTRT